MPAWGLTFRVGETIWCLDLTFLCLPKLIFILKFSGGRERTADYLGSLKKLV